MIGLAVFAGCGRQSVNSYDGYENTISPYLPITLDNQFELTSFWNYYNYPYGKTDFSEAELMIVYRAISSLRYYGSSHPWQDEQLYGRPPFLIAKNESYLTEVSFIMHPQWGALAVARVNDNPEQWFTMDSDAYEEIVGLIGWGR